MMPHDFRGHRPGDVTGPLKRPMKAVPRARCLSTKLTEAEHARFTDLAGTRSLSEWTREVLLQATTRHPIEELLLAEVLALRTILLNLHFSVATVGAPTADAMQRLIDRADREKAQQAAERLAVAKRS